MTTTNNQTAAERYRDILASRRPTYKVTSPSGMEWTLRTVSPQDYFLANQVPFRIANQVAEAMKLGKSQDEIIAAMPQEEQMEWLLFLQKLVRDAVMNPRIVDVAKEADEIDFVLEEDFQFLVEHLTGGEAARNAETFRHGSGQTSLGSIDGKKRRRKA